MSSVYSARHVSNKMSSTSSNGMWTDRLGFFRDTHHSEYDSYDAHFTNSDQKPERYSAELRRTQELLGFETSRFSHDDDTNGHMSTSVTEASIYEEDNTPEHFSTSPVLPSRSASLPWYQNPQPTEDLSTYDSSNAQQPYQRPLKDRRMVRPLPIVVPTIEVPPQEVQSAQLPVRKSSRGVVQRSLSDDGNETKTHRRHVTISEGPEAARNTLLLSTPMGYYAEDVPPLPALSPSDSTTTARWSPLPTPPLLPNPANEDKIRRELEFLTLRDGAAPLIGHKYRKMEPPAMRLDFAGEEDETPYQPEPRIRHPPKKPIDDDQRSVVSTKSEVKRRKSIFSMFQRQNELDKLLDLYLYNMVPGPKPEITRKPSLGRRMTRSFRKPVEVPPLPPMPVQQLETWI